MHFNGQQTELKNLKQTYRPGPDDQGIGFNRITTLHASYYARQAGFGLDFEAKVAGELAAFCLRRDPQVDGLWLAVQGGDMSPAEVAAFEASPWWQDAVQLRRADEAAKVVGRQTRGLEPWLPVLRQLAA
jgi:hypothetical protein